VTQRIICRQEERKGCKGHRHRQGYGGHRCRQGEREGCKGHKQGHERHKCGQGEKEGIGRSIGKGKGVLW